ncbi:hypothetical protein [uncultured Methylophaga sp.]|uniref:hypothetical protein n=1 Tax=uncultured Methylophaga sp. TaxID=285271 RepID=UPI00260852CE|nr:hypothetical protein [uncultured Methylophaga sp.]
MKNEIELPIELMDSLVEITVFQKKLLYCLFYRNTFTNAMWAPDEPSTLNFADYQVLMSEDIVDFYDFEIIINSSDALYVHIGDNTTQTKMFDKVVWNTKSKEYHFFYNNEFVEKMFRAIYSLN